MASATIPDRLKAVRAATGLTQRALASQLGVAYRTWQDIETGKNVPSGETLLKISSLGFNPGWILTGDGSMRAGDGHNSCSETESVNSPEPTPRAAIAEPELMALISDAIQRAYKDIGARLPALDLGRMIAEKYNEIISLDLTQDEWHGAVKMMASQLKKDIVTTAANTSNRKREVS